MKGQPSPIKDSADHKALKLYKGNLTYHSAGLPIEPQMELVSVETRQESRRIIQPAKQEYA